jgi:hypothetical protein
MSPLLYYALLLVVVCFFLDSRIAPPAFALALDLNSQQQQDDSSCSFHLNLSPSTDVTLQQHLSTGDNLVTISLSLEGQGWLGVGFNRNGNMIGSTVVIGFPGEPLVQDRNPGRYYLGAKDMKQINRVDASGTRVGVEWPKEAKGGSSDNNDEDEEDEPEWRRSLYLPQEHHRLLAISDASIEQNSTHTTLTFTRPLEPPSDDEYMTKVHPNDLNTLIWAVGSSNEFGYHGSQRGSYTLNFTECLHGTLVSSSSSSLLLNDDTREEVEEKEVEMDVTEFGTSPADYNLEMNSQTTAATSSGSTLGVDVTLLYYLRFMIIMTICSWFVWG